MDSPPAAEQETLQALTVEVANLASDLASYAHSLSDVDTAAPEPEMVRRVNTTKALWARDALTSILTSLGDDNY